MNHRHFYCKLLLSFLALLCIVTNGHGQEESIDTVQSNMVDSFSQQKLDDPANRQSLFTYLKNQEERPKIRIVTDAKYLLRTANKKEYQAASIEIETSDRDLSIELDGEIKVRGNMRKKVCRIPPVKFNFKKSDLDSLGFIKKLDKLKFVFPCSNNNLGEDKLLKEFFVYGLYDMVDVHGLQTFLVDVIMEHDGEEKFNFTAFIVEEEDHYCHRRDAQLIENGKIRAGGLDRKSFVKMEFFQYMIANTDWAIANKHNLELVKLKSMDRAIAVPYDFDYSGFVGQNYAMPHETLPIKSIHDRYFFNYPVTDKEFYMGANYFKVMEERIMNQCETVPYFDERQSKECINYLEPFFEDVNKPEELRAFKKKI